MVCKQHLDFYFSLIHGSGTSLVFKNILVLEVCVVLYFAVVTLSSNLQVVHLSWRYGILVASTVIKHWRTCVVILRVFPWKTLANRSYQLLLPTFCPSKNFPKMYFSPSATVTPTFPRPRTMKIGIPHVSREEDFFFPEHWPKTANVIVFSKVPAGLNNGIQLWFQELRSRPSLPAPFWKAPVVDVIFCCHQLSHSFASSSFVVGVKSPIP